MKSNNEVLEEWEKQMEEANKKLVEASNNPALDPIIQAQVKALLSNVRAGNDNSAQAIADNLTKILNDRLKDAESNR